MQKANARLPTYKQLVSVPTAVAGGAVFTAVCLFAYQHDTSKTDVARITKLDINVPR